ncbi:ROK family protein [Bacillus daqingensis]|uniref:ROK family protein n=1 Tax=Bacillus daqingensis TaxID=872396 RepID=A0ABV9NX27_9BACI
MNQHLFASFDIGGTSVKWGLVDIHGVIAEKGQFAANHGCGETILNGIHHVIRTHRARVQGVAVSAPGFIHPETGYIEMGGAVKSFDHFNLQEALEREHRLPVSVENDVNCVALAEKWLGHGTDLKDFVCLTVGTGIGGALFLNDQLYRGHAFRGGEFGFMITHGIHSSSPEYDGLSCNASMTTVREQYAKYLDLPFADVTGERVFEAYDRREPVAVQIVDAFYQTLAVGIYNIVSVLNPEKVLIGGGITARPAFLSEIRSQLAYVDRVFQTEVDTCRFKNDAGLIGAVAYHKLKYAKLEDAGRLSL